MATLKPRITVTLNQDVYDTIKGLSEAQGCSMSALISNFMEMVNPVQQRVLKAAKKLQALDTESKSNMVASLEASESQLTEMLGPLLELFDQLEGTQPPHSNTGVTNTNTSDEEDKKSASIARPRALQPVEKSKSRKVENGGRA
jgi:hypothetical protein